MTESDAQSPPPMDVVEKVDANQLQHFVTTIKTAEQQVGENIIRALQHEGTVAVLTTVVIGPDGQQQVVSAALNPAVMADVQRLLISAQEERQPEQPCVGFHCLIRPKPSDKPNEMPGDKPAGKSADKPAGSTGPTAEAPPQTDGN